METMIKKIANDKVGNSAVDWIIFGTGLLSLTLAIAMALGAQNDALAEEAEIAREIAAQFSQI